MCPTHCLPRLKTAHLSCCLKEHQFCSSDVTALETIMIYAVQTNVFFFSDHCIVWILSSSRTNITFRNLYSSHLPEANGQREVNTFSQVHGVRVVHYPVALGVPAVSTGVQLRQLNTGSPTDVKNVTGSLEKIKNKAIHGKINILSIVIILMGGTKFPGSYCLLTLWSSLLAGGQGAQEGFTL